MVTATAKNGNQVIMGRYSPPGNFSCKTAYEEYCRLGKRVLGCVVQVEAFEKVDACRCFNAFVELLMNPCGTKSLCYHPMCMYILSFCGTWKSLSFIL